MTSYPKYYKLEEKHGESFYQCNSKEAVHEMFFNILKEVYESGSFEWMDCYVPFSPIDKPDYTEEQILNYPHSIQQTLRNKWIEYKRQESDIKSFKLIYKAMNDCITNNLKDKAQSVLTALRSEYPYFPEEIDLTIYE